VDKRLIFTGYVKDQDLLAELYHNCYVYVHGHEFGGTNPTMIKAMAYGSAILALDTVFNKEMLQKGKYGLFFKKELLSITNQINYCEKETLLIEKSRSESKNGITKKYNWDFITENYLELFKKLIQRNKIR
jgi:glycosyltransferase involved in cell wall biosynthesis